MGIYMCVCVYHIPHLYVWKLTGVGNKNGAATINHRCWQRCQLQFFLMKRDFALKKKEENNWGEMLSNRFYFYYIFFHLFERILEWRKQIVVVAFHLATKLTNTNHPPSSRSPPVYFIYNLCARKKGRERKAWQGTARKAGKNREINF